MRSPRARATPPAARSTPSRASSAAARSSGVRGGAMSGSLLGAEGRRRALAAAACCALAASVAAGGDSKSEPTWPWGAPPGTSGAAEGKKDLFNLGLVGAKASDADRAQETGPAPSGTRAVAISDDPSADAGPDRLRVEVLFPDGPADKAGLRVG